jgi:hypothetical protein
MTELYTQQILPWSIFLLSSLPALLWWRTQVRKRRFSEARLRIARSVTEMERLMLKGEITLGCASHDVFFRLMQRVQISDDYPVNWNILKKEDKRTRNLKRQLHEELKHKDCKFSVYLENFARSYFAAFRYRHPFQWAAYSLHLLLLRGGYRILLGGLKLALITLLSIRRWSDAMAKWQEARRRNRSHKIETYLVNSTAILKKA